jgi:hypothetical protein
MQWVSTFASGASSLGRSRRLAVTRLNRVRQAPRGKLDENSPHIYRGPKKEKRKQKNCRDQRDLTTSNALSN